MENTLKHVYLVGGAVRDKLLNRAAADQDFVVVGETPETMLAQRSLAEVSVRYVHLKPGERKNRW